MEPMEQYSEETLKQARAPIASLISKSEKAQQKLAPGTWQHTMLRDNLKALYIASALMAEDPAGASHVAQNDLEDGLRALASMAERTEKARAKFSPGTSQHTLATNRLNALHIARAFVQAELDKR